MDPGLSSLQSKIYGAKPAYDYVHRCWSCCQTVVTAAVANPHRVDGLAAGGATAELSKSRVSVFGRDATREIRTDEPIRARYAKLPTLHEHRLGDRKRTEMAVDIVRQLEAEGDYPQADYAFDQGVLTHALTTLIESAGKHWVSEIERTDWFYGKANGNRFRAWQGL